MVIYVAETGYRRIFSNSKKETYSECKQYICIRRYKNCTKGSNIAKHAWDHDHKIDFENGKVIDSGNCRTKKTLESRHTAVIANSDNNSKPFPKYAMLVHKICNR